MKSSFKGAWLACAAFFVSRSFLFGINPFISAIFMATYLRNGPCALVYIFGVIGIATTKNLFDVVTFGIILCVQAMTIYALGKKCSRSNKWNWSFAVFLISIAVRFSFWITGINRSVDIMAMLLEGIIAMSLVIVFEKAIDVIENDIVKIVIDNESSISVMALLGSCLYGVPIEIIGNIRVAEVVGWIFLLIALYRFGLGIGMVWAVVFSGIMVIKTGMGEYLSSGIVVSVVTLTIGCLFSRKRLAMAVAFCGVYYLIGNYYWEYFLSEGSIKSAVAAVCVFILVPSAFLVQVDERVKKGQIYEASNEWGKLIIDRVKEFGNAFKRIECVLAGDSNYGVSFEEIGEIISGFTNSLEKVVPIKKTIETEIIDDLTKKNIIVKNLMFTKNLDNRFQIYITVKMRKGGVITANEINSIVTKYIGVELEVNNESRGIVGQEFSVIVLEEKPRFICKSAVRKLSKYNGEISGDNFSLGEIEHGQMLMLLADGMGSGVKASKDSELLIESMEELLQAGFSKEMSVKIVNTYLAKKNRGESFATLDMLLIDLYTGLGRLYKQGAAASFIKHGDWIEMIKSTSLPMGVIDSAICEKCVKKFYDKDLIIMISDGVLESIIFENKEDYMKELISNIDSRDPDEVAGEIVDAIRSQSGRRLNDDATVLVASLFVHK